MSAGTPQAFAHLHDLLKQLQDAQQLLDHGPMRISLSEKKIEAAEKECAAQKEVIKQLRKSADQSAMNLKSQEAQVAKLSGRLNEASSNKEYEIIQGQMSSEKVKGANLEDEVLELLSKVDDATAELKAKESQLEELIKKKVEITATVQANEPGLKADVERLLAAISEAESVIPAGFPRDTYKRLRESQGASAMSRVEDTYCEECNTQAISQDVVQMNMGKFTLCRACGRILYRIPAAE